MTKNEFLERIEKFLKRKNMSAAKFGRLAINDSSFVLRLRNGRECREETQHKCLDFMKHWRKNK